MATPVISPADEGTILQEEVRLPVEASPQVGTLPAGEPEKEIHVRQIGVSRPPLEVEDLPTPEQVFKIKRIGLEELVLFILGPSVIALSISLGSGEWMLGPLSISRYGFKGLGTIIIISAILQVCYNVELARFTLATGESPVVAFGRTPPGYKLWVPLAIVSFYMAFILGSWAVGAGSSLFTLFNGRAYNPSVLSELEAVRLMGIGLMFVCLLAFIVGRKIERSLEIVNGILLAFMLISLVVVTLVVVPMFFWGSSLTALLTPALPPKGISASDLGSVAGFVALASGLNFMMVGYYRDKGYGMGSKVGYLSGLFGGKPGSLAPVGKTFPDDEKNARIWKRWFKLLLIDQWGVYFVGALVGMILPGVLVSYIVSLPGVELPTSSNMVVFAALRLGDRFGPVLFAWGLLMGFVYLFTTQLVILEMLSRNFTDAIFSLSSRFRELVHNDPRRFYYPFYFVLFALISFFIHQGDMGALNRISSNLSNFAALLFPLVMIYLNRQLPKAARPGWLANLALIGNTLFFGFFFINFLAELLFKTPLVRF